MNQVKELFHFDGNWHWSTLSFILLPTVVGTYIGFICASGSDFWFLSPLFGLMFGAFGMLIGLRTSNFIGKRIGWPVNIAVDEFSDEGAWIFVSHSSKDWSKIKRIRNLLDSKGHKPLLFYLKCLEEESELDDLIKREIEARSWFFLCESENSRKSKWVGAEVAYIKQLPGKYYETINLNSSFEKQIARIDRLSIRLTVFVSSTSVDNRDIARKAKTPRLLRL